MVKQNEIQSQFKGDMTPGRRPSPPKNRDCLKVDHGPCSYTPCPTCDGGLAVRYDAAIHGPAICPTCDGRGHMENIPLGPTRSLPRSLDRIAVYMARNNDRAYFDSEIASVFNDADYSDDGGRLTE